MVTPCTIPGAGAASNPRGIAINTATRALRLALLLGACLAAAQSHAFVCRVTTTGSDTGDGSDWNAQAMDPHTALGDTGCNEIWVAGGVYRPGAAGDRAASFTIDREVGVYGGFDGTETDLAERDPAANPTVLSGDIDNNDNTNADGVTETADDIAGNNSFHVVFIDGTTAAGPITATTVLDGFVITAGQANGTNTNEDSRGGGLFCAGDGDGNECSPALNNLTFNGHSATQDGGAMYNDGSDDGISNPALNHVIFSGNFAAHGGAMFNDGRLGGVSNPVLNYVSFSGNNAISFGGAMYNDGGNGGISSPALNHVAFNGNGGTGLGGVSQGGAIYNSGESAGVSSPVLNNVTFSGNNSTDSGGAMFNNGVGNGVSSPVLNNVTFSGNSAVFAQGGAIFNQGNSGVSSPELKNVTFSGNSANQGGAMFNSGGSGTASPALNNVILWGNTAISGVGRDIFNSLAAPSINDSIVQSGCPVGSICNNVSLQDPLLSPLADNGGFTQTMLPDVDGAAADAGNNATCTGEDQRGVPRPQGDNCDIGAVELRSLLEFDPAGLDFESVEIGTTSEPLIAVLENVGDTDLTGLAFTVPAGFDAGTGDCGATLAAGSSCQVSVTFSPGGTGAAGGVLVADSAEGAAADLALAGNGVEPGALGTDPDNLHFEEVVITRTRTLPFSIVNTGGTGVELSSVTVESGGPAFAIAGIGCAGGTVLDPGESCAVDISFTPQQVALHEGAVRITSDDGQEYAMSLSGTVLPDDILADRFEQPPPVIR